MKTLTKWLHCLMVAVILCGTVGSVMSVSAHAGGETSKSDA